MAESRLETGPSITSHDPLFRPGADLDDVADRIGTYVGSPPRARLWLLLLVAAALLLFLFVVSIAVILVVGVGAWGIGIPVAWGFAITNFVWWIGIAHAGTLISAALLLLHEEWRHSIARMGEAMTIFAVASAALFPLLHLGRPARFYWMLPYPDTMDLWPQWRSPLVWDFFAIAVYGVVSLLFWYVGLLPDLAAMRDRPGGLLRRRLFALASVGWTGAGSDWTRYRKVLLVFAVLTPLILAVHSNAAFNFAVSIVPTWHSTLLPLYFTAGAFLSGLGMLLAAGIPLRAAYRLHDIITTRHLDNIGRLLLAMSLLIAWAHLNQYFLTWYKGSRFDESPIVFAAFGNYAPVFWTFMILNVGLPQLLWSGAIRRSPAWLFAIGLSVVAGLWLERFTVVMVSLHRGYLPSMWDQLFSPTVWDWAMLFGSMGLFLVMFLLFVRFLPVAPMSELRRLVARRSASGGAR